MRYAQRLVFTAAVYIHGFSLCRSRLLFISFLLVRSRSVVPGVLEANECLAVVVGSEHQLFDVLAAACSCSRVAFLRDTYEEPHRCAETAGGDSVKRPDRRDANGVAAVCVRDGVGAGHCGVRLLCGSQRGLGMGVCLRVLDAVWVSRAGGLVATSLIPRSPLVSLSSTEVRF
jgi:hypothetical protein